LILVNRRMPNGTYGGVRGEVGDGLTYSIAPTARLRTVLCSA
jgi:hypothetical protein